MNRFQRFMSGRYGNDQLGRFLLIVATAFLLLGTFVRSLNFFFSGACTILLMYNLFRIFSKNLAKRREENAAYLRWKESVIAFFRRNGAARKDKDHCYFTCPTCKQKVRVPKGHGAVKIHCPKCRTDFIRRT